MSSTSEIARRYFQALDAHDLDGALALWQAGARDRLVGQRELVAPHEVREYFASLLAAFPDLRLQIVDLTTYRNRTAVRWLARGGFPLQTMNVYLIEDGDGVTVLDAGVASMSTGRRGPARVPHPAFNHDTRAVAAVH
jgi:hypothetical protein